MRYNKSPEQCKPRWAWESIFGIWIMWEIYSFLHSGLSTVTLILQCQINYQKSEIIRQARAILSQRPGPDQSDYGFREKAKQIPKTSNRISLNNSRKYMFGRLRGTVSVLYRPVSDMRLRDIFTCSGRRPGNYPVKPITTTKRGSLKGTLKG
ncbi:MAG TPA: hypothetical protein VM123_14270 [archaeon]|nr:hypothetical protein [archaeon]